MLIARGDPPEVPRAIDPRGYAVPRKPIRVVMAQDEEAAGVESEAVRMKPPAYGLWRESVVRFVLSSTSLIVFSPKAQN